MPHTLIQWLAFLGVILGGLVVHRLIVSMIVMQRLLDPRELYNRGPLTEGERQGGIEQFANVHLGAWVGTLEIAIYATSVVFRHPEFILVWFATKYVASMRRWGTSALGRTFYNRSLIGSGLDLLVGVATGGVAQCVIRALAQG